MKFLISEKLIWSELVIAAELHRVLDQIARDSEAMALFDQNGSLWVGSPSGIRIFLKSELDRGFDSEEIKKHYLYETFVISEQNAEQFDVKEWSPKKIYSLPENIESSDNAVIIVRAFRSTFLEYFKECFSPYWSERNIGIDKSVTTLIDGRTSIRIASSLLGVNPEQILDYLTGKASSHSLHDWMLDGAAEQIDQADPLDSTIDFLKTARWAYFERFVNDPNTIDDIV